VNDVPEASVVVDGFGDPILAVGALPITFHITPQACSCSCSRR